MCQILNIVYSSTIKPVLPIKYNTHSSIVNNNNKNIPEPSNQKLDHCVQSKRGNPIGENNLDMMGMLPSDGTLDSYQEAVDT